MARWLPIGISSRDLGRRWRHVVWKPWPIHACSPEPTEGMQTYSSSTSSHRLCDYITRPDVEIRDLTFGGISWQHWRIDMAYRLLWELDNQLVGEWRAIDRTHLITCKSWRVYEQCNVISLRSRSRSVTMRTNKRERQHRRIGICNTWSIADGPLRVAAHCKVPWIILEVIGIMCFTCLLEVSSSSEPGEQSTPIIILTKMQ